MNAPSSTAPAEPQAQQACAGCFFLRGSFNATCRRGHPVIWRAAQDRPPSHPWRADSGLCADFWNINRFATVSPLERKSP